MTLNVCGVHQWTKEIEDIELSDDSILGSLIRGDLSQALVGLEEMKAEIEECGATVSCEIQGGR